MYINTYLIPVPEDKKDEYTKICTIFIDVAKDFGALEIFENWESDIPDGEHTDYRKAVQAQSGEKIVNSWVVWPDRATADIAHKGMFEDARMQAVGEMPFDGKRMVLGGFEPLVSWHKNSD